MKNLSKVLALVLALALTLTMFAGATVVSNKGYSDDEALTAAGKEAVAVLSALGVINGYPDGEYKPANFVTRAEFAKMITVAKTADPVASFYSVSSLSFKDTAGHWALNYLNYVNLNEIMVGYGDGTARPDANVTGAEAIKMTLVALGYNPKVEGLEGSAWISNTVSLASRIGLLKNLEAANLYAAFSREQNAILIYNAIYTKTVTYVAGNYVAKDVTLGVEVFDLLDITGVMVANDIAALGANWTNVLNERGNTNQVNSYMLYNKAAADQAIFVYRDYTGASTVGGYYVPRAVTVNLKSINVDSTFGDLGKAYRVLTTGAKTPYNTTEVRKVYGILWEASDNYVSGTKEINALTKPNVQAMLDSAKKTDVNVGGASKQGNVFINGAVASYDEAIALAGNASTAPFRYVDNNNDGIWDSLFINTYTLAYVQNVTDDNYVLVGLSGGGTIKKSVTTVVTADYTPAAGDYVAYYANNDNDRYIKKLDVVTDRVTGYDGSKYTIGATKYSFGSLATQADKDGFLDLMGAGYSAVNGPVLKYTMDGSYIVLVESTNATSFEKYGIVIGYNESTVLGLAQVRIYNADNEYKDYFISSVNGKQQYNQVVDLESAGWHGDLPGVNTLVAYIENGNYIALYYYDGANNNGFGLINGGKYSEDYNFAYNNLESQKDTWYGSVAGSNNLWNTAFKNANGVVFVSYGWRLNGRHDMEYSLNSNIQYASRHTLQWKAYKPGEFQPSYFTAAAEVGIPSNAKVHNWEIDDVVLYAENINGYNLIKAAAITFDNAHKGYVLPGLPIRAGQNYYATVTGVGAVVYDSEKGVYNYSVTILQPMSTTTKTVTVQSSAYALNTFVKGDVYKFFADADGIVRRWENAKGYNWINIKDGLEIGGTFAKFYISGAYKNTDGSYNLFIKSPYAINGLFGVYELTLTVPANADMYFVENLFGGNDFKAFDYTKLPAYGNLFGNADGKLYLVHADMNPATMTVNSLWIDTAPKNEFKFDLQYTLTSYDETNGEATYKVSTPPYFGLNFAKTGDTSITLNQLPSELFLNEGKSGLLPSLVKMDSDGFFRIYDIGTSFKTTTHDKKNTQTIVFNENGTIEAYTGSTGSTPFQTWNITDDTQIWWYRTSDGRIDPAADVIGAGAGDVGDFYLDNATAITLLSGGKNPYTPNGKDALSFETMIVLSVGSSKDASIIVLIDTDSIPAPAVWPYNDIQPA